MLIFPIYGGLSTIKPIEAVYDKVCLEQVCIIKTRLWQHASRNMFTHQSVIQVQTDFIGEKLCSA